MTTIPANPGYYLISFPHPLSYKMWDAFQTAAEEVDKSPIVAWDISETDEDVETLYPVILNTSHWNDYYCQVILCPDGRVIWRRGRDLCDDFETKKELMDWLEEICLDATENWFLYEYGETDKETSLCDESKVNVRTVTTQPASNVKRILDEDKINTGKMSDSEWRTTLQTRINDRYEASIRKEKRNSLPNEIYKP